MSPLLSSLLVAFFLGQALGQASPTVQVESGVLNGAKCPTVNAYSFLGIPFAQPPVGDLRFAPPVSFQGNFSNGSLTATQEPPACIQFGSVSVASNRQSEDCLFLNIWVPTNATNMSSLPVKVWIYGGQEEDGAISDSLYNGCYLASDSIVVSVAYRLGSLGFLALEDAGIGGNFGVQDILLGLEWIQSNIAAFGGNPKQVLLFGQSAGAQLVWYISTLSQAPSLINAAIGESGAGQPIPNYSEYQAFGKSYAAAVGCNVSDIGCFRSKSSAELNSSTAIFPATYLETPQRFQPFLDGKVIAVDPLIAGSKVPLLAGSTSMEGTIITLGQFNNPIAITEADYSAFLNYTFGSLAANVSYYYPMSAFESTGLPGFYAISTVLTDSYFKCPTYRALTATTKAGVPAWTYLDDHTPSCGAAGLTSPDILKLLGPTHASEIPFVFAELTNLPPPAGNCSFDEQEVQISKALTSAWSSMAANGNPNGGIDISGGPWPAYNVSESQGVIIGNNTAVGYVNYTVCAFWNIIAAVQNSSGPSVASTTSSGSPTASTTSSGAPTASPTNSPAQLAFPEIPKVIAITALLVLLSSIL